MVSYQLNYSKQQEKGYVQCNHHFKVSLILIFICPLRKSRMDPGTVKLKTLPLCPRRTQKLQFTTIEAAPLRQEAQGPMAPSAERCAVLSHTDSRSGC